MHKPKMIIAAFTVALITASSGLAAETRPIGLSKIITTVQAGSVWAKLNTRSGDCFVPLGATPTLAWQSGSGGLDRRQILPVFAQEIANAGFKSADDPSDLFQKNRGEADLQLAGNIRKIDANLCVGHRGGYGFAFGSPEAIERLRRERSQPDIDSTYGDVSIEVDWQIFSTSADKVVADIPITSTFAVSKHAPGNYAKLFDGAIRENLKSLIATSLFQSVVNSPTTPESFSIATAPKIRITASSIPVMKISDAVGSVVLIQSAGGHGSGFLVSFDGYVMTAQHVVGGDKYVKIRWSDGLEGVGEVIRTDKRRDVAILKTDPRGRQPLALHRATPQAGDTVFAIGAPLDVKNQSTVTRGVASANRIMDGFSFIQSDVTISPGSSGGPLLDEKGQVLGICDLSYRPAGPDVPTGINFFVPIDDALRFLSADPG